MQPFGRNRYGPKIGSRPWPDDFVLDGDPAPPPQKGGRAPHFSAHVYCGQTAGWMKLVLGMVLALAQATLC